MPAEPASAPRRRRGWLIALQILGTAAGFAYIFLVADLGKTWAAIARTPLWTIGAGVGLVLVNVGAGAVRWQTMLRVYGAEHVPGLPRLYRGYLIGLFYNTFLPGGVGGDVVRGVITRRAFGERGATAGIAVVMVERAFGLAGLAILASVALLIHPLPGIEGAPLLAAAGLAAALIGVIGVATARRIAPKLPGKLREIAGALPPVQRPAGYVVVLLLSVVTQSLIALVGFLFLSVHAPQVTLLDAMVIVPAAAAAAFFPLTIGGAGAREAALVALATRVLGIGESDAVATSLLLWLCLALVAATGAVAQAFERGK
jgi:uncharacterized membrane protein YbhN (UPF0104 family)